MKLILLVTAVMLFATGLTSGLQSSARNHSMEQKPDNGSVFRRALEMWASGDLSPFDSIIAPGYVGHTVSGSRDQEGLKARIRGFRRIYPDVEFKFGDQFVSGEKVVTRLSGHATNSSTGARTEMMGINISRVVDGRIVEEWATWEFLAK